MVPFDRSENRDVEYSRLDFSMRPPALRGRSMLVHSNALHYRREHLNGTRYHITVIMEYERQRLVMKVASCIHMP